MLNPQQFYTECITEFHKEAQKYNVANKGLIFIPELIPIGQKVVLALLQDDLYQMMYRDSAEGYYRYILSLSIDAGIDVATKWHDDFKGLNAYVDEMLENGPADDADQIIKDELPKGIDDSLKNPLFEAEFKVWLKEHEPYWNLNDPRSYTFNAMLAGYQLGISIILEKYGY